MTEQSTSTLGEVFGLPIPGNAHMTVGVHHLTVPQVDRLVADALAAGLPVTARQHQGTRWVRIGVAGMMEVTLFSPSGHYPDAALMDSVDRKLALLKFIEIPAHDSRCVCGGTGFAGNGERCVQ